MDTFLVAVRVVVSLAVVLGLLWYLQRRIGRTGRAQKITNPISIVGKRAVGQKAAVVVVDLDGQRFLLGVTDRAVTVLHTAERPLPSEAEFARSMTEAMASPAASSPAPAAAPTLVPSIVGPTRVGPALVGPALVGPAPVGPAPVGAALAASALAAASPLGGSILSPAIWRQTAAVIRRAVR